MAIIKVSNKNSLGFKHHAYHGFLWAVLALIGGNIIYDTLGDLLFIPTIVLYNIISVRKERSAPFFFAKRDPLLPRNDLECWCASTFAIWAEFFDIYEGWPLICGAHKSKKFIKSMRASLDEDWGIHNREECLEMVRSLTDRHKESPDVPDAGWDLCRTTQLLAMMYAADWCSRDELDQEFSKAGTAIQRRFQSWDELCQSYLAGYAAWLRKVQGDSTEWSITERHLIFEKLKSNKYGPYAIPWNVNLTWRQGMPESSDRTETAKLLARYNKEGFYFK